MAFIASCSAPVALSSMASNSQLTLRTDTISKVCVRKERRPKHVNVLVMLPHLGNRESIERVDVS